MRWINASHIRTTSMRKYSGRKTNKPKHYWSKKRIARFNSGIDPKSVSLDIEMTVEMDRTPQGPVSEDNLGKLIVRMIDRLGRVPEHWEVLTMIYGNEEMQLIVWNSAKVGPLTCQTTLSPFEMTTKKL